MIGLHEKKPEQCGGELERMNVSIEVSFMVLMITMVLRFPRWLSDQMQHVFQMLIIMIEERKILNSEQTHHNNNEIYISPYKK